MDTIDEQIRLIQEEIRKTPHHKGTNRFLGLMRAKIARLKDKQIEGGAHLHQSSGGQGGFAVRKQGDATVVLIGPPSAGKSTLINKLTNAESKVAAYAFTTVTVIPGMFKYKNAYIQILDIPGLIEGAREGKGRGREVLSVARGADLLLIMTDVDRVGLIPKMSTELEGAGIRINQTPPDIVIDRKLTGGLEIHSNLKQDLDKETIKEIAREYGIKNGDITIKEKISYERLFDALSANRVYIPAICAVNKIDLRKNIKKNPDYIYFSSQTGENLQVLIDAIWKSFKFLTVQVESGSIIIKEGETLKDVAFKIGSNFAENKKLAKIWGVGARFPGQEVSLSAKAQEGMSIRFV